jgi:D-psicose/D-tagatose/L-ribulose 3-epimerase
MKFGMNLLLWTDGVSEAQIPVLEQLKAVGYDGVELPMFDLDPANYRAWGRRLEDLGLERTGVTVRVEADNPISADPRVREAGIANNRRVLECCQAAGVKLLVGPYHSALGVFSGSGPTAEEWKRGIESMRAMAEHAETCGVTLGVEYLNRFECYLLNCAADTLRFVKEVDHPRCRMMYDTFHANIEEKDIGAAIRACASHTVHIHISENDRSTPGQGHVDWKTTFDALKSTSYDGWLMVEAFGLALPRVAAATKIWRRMYQNEEQLARDALKFMKNEWSIRK